MALTSETTFPNVNINGTSAESLMEQHLEIMHRCTLLIEAMSQAMPHGRDYATPDACTNARGEHRARMMEIETIRQCAEKIALNIQEQGE